jgi:hypothetical protein
MDDPVRSRAIEEFSDKSAADIALRDRAETAGNKTP